MKYLWWNINWWLLEYGKRRTNNEVIEEEFELYISGNTDEALDNDELFKKLSYHQ